MTAQTLHRRCCGKARGWAACTHGWGTDGGFPREGWWAVRAVGSRLWLGSTTDAVLRQFAGAPAPAPLRPSETP